MDKDKQPKPHIIKLGPDEILCESRELSEPEKPYVYLFHARDVIPLFLDDDVDAGIKNDMLLLGDKSDKKEDAKKEERETPKRREGPDLDFNSCACVLLLIVSKTPRTGGGALRGSRYRNGRWRTREFVRKWSRALSVWQDCAEFCIYVYDDLDLSGNGYDHFYGRDINGNLIEFPELAEAGDFMDKLQRDFWWIITQRCFTFVINRNHAFGNPSGRTPMNILDPDEDATRVQSENLSFVTDNLAWYKIAHEMGHMANLTHAKDNHIHKRNGQFDQHYYPNDTERDENDIMQQASSENPSVRLEDCALFLDHIANNKSCEL